MERDHLPVFEETLRARRGVDPGAYTPQRQEMPLSNPNPVLEDVRIFSPADPRLKRHVIHDRRSRHYAIPTAAAIPRRAIAWPRVGQILDQGDIGSCTANAALGLLMTYPFTRGITYTQTECQQLYREETRLDNREIPGAWEPDDTGSAGIYAMKALKARKLIRGYRHAFSVNTAIGALERGPIAVGTVWLDSMMEPDPNTGILTVDRSQPQTGGHEYVVDGWWPGPGFVRVTNSWGEQWGHHGSAYLGYDDLRWLLSQRGDVVQPVVT